MSSGTRKKIEHQARKDLIIKGALNVFKSKGIEKATMDEIALEADFGKATLYYYFKSKEDIFNTILNSGWTTLWNEVKNIPIDIDSPRKQFLKLIKSIIELVNTNRPLYEFLFVAPHQSPGQDEEEPEWKNYQIQFINEIHSIIKLGIEKEEFPQIDSQLTLQAFGHMFHGMILIGKERQNINEKDIEELFLKLLKKKYS